MAVTTDRALWDEFGLMSATEGDYGTFQATAYRFKDPTDAFAAEQWLAGSGAGATLAGNYVITCQTVGSKAGCPAAADLKKVELPRQRRDEQPLVWAYLPSQGMAPNSGRYALGPVGLKQFAPQIPAAAAGFQFGTEVAMAKYRTPRGEEQLVLFYFPIPQMARRQLPEFQKLSGAVVRRSGSLIALVADPPDVEAANRLVGEINYRASVSYDQQPPVPVRPETVGRMILSILELAGLLIVFCILAGLGFAGIQILRRRLGPENADGAMIALHLVDR